MINLALPKISIITVCYNSANTIKKTFDSLINQNYSNIQYIVIDGESTDDTVDIIEEYKSKFNFEFIYISEPDNGIYDAMNKGINFVNGDLVGIINSDDWYEHNALYNIAEKYNMICKHDKYELYYGACRFIQNDKEKEIIFYNHNFLSDRMLPHPTCFLSANIYRDLCKFDCKYKIAADYDLILKLYIKYKVTFIPVYSIISNFVIGGMSSKAAVVYETALIQYKYKCISLKKYVFTLLKYILKRVTNNNE